MMKANTKKIYIISLILIVIDQCIKLFISNQMGLYDTFTIIKNFLYINLVHNSGAAFSFLQGGRILFILIAIFVVIFLILFIRKNEFKNTKDILIFSLLLGGIIGNLIDRIVYGYVIDYISLTFGNYNFPVFNFADSCIVIAAILIIVNTVKEELWK